MGGMPIMNFPYNKSNKTGRGAYPLLSFVKIARDGHDLKIVAI